MRLATHPLVPNDGGPLSTVELLERFRQAVQTPPGRQTTIPAGGSLRATLHSAIASDSPQGRSAKSLAVRAVLAATVIVAGAGAAHRLWTASAPDHNGSVPAGLNALAPAPAPAPAGSPSASAPAPQAPALLRDTQYLLNTNLSTLREEQVHQALRYVPIEFKGESRQTLDATSRLLLSKWASDRVGISEYGLNWKDLYGVIHAESSWVPRTGIGNNGVYSHGLAQFEGPTARGYGLADARDVTSSVEAAARLVRDAASWTTKRLKLGEDAGPRQQQALREGISVFYNTSWKTRHRWDVERGQRLPLATRTHIRNVKAGELIAANLANALQAGTELVKPTVFMERSAVHQANDAVAHLKVETRDAAAARTGDGRDQARRAAKTAAKGDPLSGADGRPPSASGKPLKPRGATAATAAASPSQKAAMELKRATAAARLIDQHGSRALPRAKR